MKIRVVSASQVAKLMAPEPSGTLESMKFGKKFEQAFSKICWLMEKEGLEWIDPKTVESNTKTCPDCNHQFLEEEITEEQYIFCDMCKRRWCENCNIPSFAWGSPYPDFFCGECIGTAILAELNNHFTQDDLNLARTISINFLRIGIKGRTPKTQYKQIAGDKYISYKPDIVKDKYPMSDTYTEFKTGKIEAYQIAQSKIFSWCIGEPITLVGWDHENKKPIISTIDGNNLQLPTIPDNLFSDCELCDGCMRNYGLCRCGEFDYSFPNYNEDEEDDYY